MVYCCTTPGQIYAIYAENAGELVVDLSDVKGTFEVKWYDPRNGGALQDSTVKHSKGGKTIGLGPAPSVPDQDWAVHVGKQ